MAPKDQLFKRLSKKAKRGMRGWPLATIVWCGCQPGHEGRGQSSPVRMRSPARCGIGKIVHGDVPKKPEILAEMLAFMEGYGVKSVVMSAGLRGCPHQEGIDYHGQWCPDPACAFWHGRDRFTGKLVQRGPVVRLLLVKDSCDCGSCWPIGCSKRATRSMP